MSISVVLLAYQEEENLKILLPKIKTVMDKIKETYEIIVIDTATPLDHTKEVCDKFGAKYFNQEKPFFGGAFKTGIQYAQMDKFLILDSDGSHDPSYIPAIYKKFTEDNCDVVIGSRYVSGGQTFDSKSSIIMSKILNFFFRICLGINAKDISTDYRMYDMKQLKKVGPELKNKNYDILQEVLLRLKLNNVDLKIGEIPISFQKRIYGESKRKLIPFIASYAKSLIHLTFMRFPTLRNFLLYAIFGMFAAVLEFSMFSMLTKIIVPEYANIIGAVCGFLFTFTANTFLNFKMGNRFLFRFLTYGCICLIGVAFSTTVIHLAKDVINIFALKAVLIVIVALLQFILNKYITYRR